MKYINTTILSLSITLLVLSGCKKDFENMNTNPESITDINPESLFYTAQTQMLTPGNLWNDVYASKLRWMQYTANIWGYSTTNFTIFSSNIGADLYREYNNVGAYITNLEYIVSKSKKEAEYSTMVQAGKILLITKAIQTTDIHGSLAYSEAWKVRAGGQSTDDLSPRFENQETLFKIWDSQLKEIIRSLKQSSTTSRNFGGYDRAFGGDISKWIKTANALRLRIAIRLWSRLPDLALSIAGEVLATTNTAFIPSGTADSFILWHANDYTTYNQGDWHSIYDMDCAAAPFMDYLKKHEDPRKQIFFHENNLTANNITAYNAQTDNNKLGGNITSRMSRWEGGTVSFDFRATDEPYLARKLYGTVTTDMRAMNYPQTRLWKGTGYDGTGSGGNFAPLITYADFCFMAAEFSLRAGISNSKSAEEWYTEGVKSSVKQWYQIGEYSKVDQFKAIDENTLSEFLTRPGIKWNTSVALEQIYAQAYVEHFKNTNESWAQWKRTNFPNKNSSIIKFHNVLINGVEQNVPRKVKFIYPTPGTTNYENAKARIDNMIKESSFISADNEFGKLWWEN
ncbi:SusD/RagB family nutrient-binding outer membrane lipoprotein [Sphingobacterium spiritivorum]|uniref:SusD/RagB family nutrient-binding outer membrane lipoprotein n=1 Tax=Sphingobacterium spiritivorum TaxID=258 RepID=UPI003DA55549